MRKNEDVEIPRHSVAVETDLFEHREVKPHFINSCCFGEDFAKWLKQELSTITSLGFDLSEVIQEDHGWGFWISHGTARFWVALSFVGNGPREPPAQWVVSINYDPGLNIVKRLFHKSDQSVLSELRDRVRRILAANNAIKMIKM